MQLEMYVIKDGHSANATFVDGLFLISGAQLIPLEEEYAIQREINLVIDNSSYGDDPVLTISYAVLNHFERIEVFAI